MREFFKGRWNKEKLRSVLNIVHNQALPRTPYCDLWQASYACISVTSEFDPH